MGFDDRDNTKKLRILISIKVPSKNIYGTFLYIYMIVFEASIYSSNNIDNNNDDDGNNNNNNNGNNSKYITSSGSNNNIMTMMLLTTVIMMTVSIRNNCRYCFSYFSFYHN